MVCNKITPAHLRYTDDLSDHENDDVVDFLTMLLTDDGFTNYLWLS